MIPHISVCICTFQRPEYLENLLNDLLQQITNGLFFFSIIVVDNDQAESARKIVESIKKKSQIKIEYHVEPVQNISLARNKAVQHADGEFVAFIDDDEFPVKKWLLLHFKAIHQFQCDGILGPVIPFYEIEPPAWVKKGSFYNRPVHDDGIVLKWNETRTGNAFLKREIFFKCENKFKPELGSGGEDREFFRRMIEQGYIFKWCNEALVYERIPPERLKRSFMLRRALLRGKNPSLGRTNLLKSFLAVPVYTIILPFSLFFGHHQFMNILIKNFDHIGRILNFLNLNFIKEKYLFR